MLPIERNGAVTAALRVWNGALTATQVAALKPLDAVLGVQTQIATATTSVLGHLASFWMGPLV